MRYRQPTSRRSRRSDPRDRSFLGLFFPDWWEARERRRKGVMVLFVLAFVVVLLSVLAERLGWDLAPLLAWVGRV